MEPRLGAKVWVPRLDSKVGYHGWGAQDVLRLGRKVWFKGRVPKEDLKSEFQAWVTKFGSKTEPKFLGPKVKSLGRVPRFGTKVGHE